MIKVRINNICAKPTECEPLTSGMIGNLVEVSFSSEWDSLNKIAVFSNGDVTIDVLESQWNGNTITIPHEVLAVPNRTIVFGVYGFGVENGTVHALPTIYAKIGIPMVGADPESDPTTDPSLPVYAQLQWQIDHFEISDEQIAQQIQEYLETHPIGIEPATATRLGGVKVGEGLSVTADGTLSADAPDLSEYAKTADLDELANIVDGKQDTITDLDTIRSGAALGATALQSVPNTYRTAMAQDTVDAQWRDRIEAIEDKESGWDAKQNAIADLATIRSGAALGATALQSVPNTYRTASAQDVIDDAQDTAISAKYTKPSGGIPKTDLASAVQTSLEKADTALQQHQDISGKENTSNKVTTISSASTNTQYPSAKAVYDFIASLNGNGVAY